jgi:Leucine Rich repeats (2 copies)
MSNCPVHPEKLLHRFRAVTTRPWLSAAADFVGARPLGVALIASAMSAVALANIPVAERDLLVAIYKGTNGANWVNNKNWLGAPGTECSWYGVVCDGARGAIVRLDLSDNNLNGSLPNSLNELSTLITLNLSGNRLSGEIPSIVNLKQLQSFDVSHNSLSGSIPSLTGLFRLQNFSVHHNELTGRVPRLDGLLELRVLRLNNNRLTGATPKLISLTQLEVLDVGGNQFE